MSFGACRKRVESCKNFDGGINPTLVLRLGGPSGFSGSQFFNAAFQIFVFDLILRAVNLWAGEQGGTMMGRLNPAVRGVAMPCRSLASKNKLEDRTRWKSLFVADGQRWSFKTGEVLHSSPVLPHGNLYFRGRTVFSTVSARRPGAFIPFTDQTARVAVPMANSKAKFRKFGSRHVRDSAPNF
jgi:hypothetical protein